MTTILITIGIVLAAGGGFLLAQVNSGLGLILYAIGLFQVAQIVQAHKHRKEIQAFAAETLALQDGFTRRCPACVSFIHDQARRCPYCRVDLP